MGNFWSTEELGDIKPEIMHYKDKEDSPVTVVEYPIGYINELKKNDKFNDRRSCEQSQT